MQPYISLSTNTPSVDAHMHGRSLNINGATAAQAHKHSSTCADGREVLHDEMMEIIIGVCQMVIL